MEKDDNLNNDDLFDRAKDYINTNIELAKLTVIQSAVKTVGSVVSSLILVVVAIFFLAFLSIAVGLYLGELLSSMYKGFFIVTLFYFLVGIIIMLISKNYIQNPIINLLIRKIFKKGE